MPSYDLSSGPDKCLEDPFHVYLAIIIITYHVCVLHGMVKVQKGQESDLCQIQSKGVHSVILEEPGGLTQHVA